MRHFILFYIFLLWCTVDSFCRLLAGYVLCTWIISFLLAAGLFSIKAVNLVFWSCFFSHGVYSVHCAPTFEFACPLRIATGHITVIFSFFYNWGDTNCEHHFPCSTSQLGSCIYESIVCVLHADLPIGAFPTNTVYKISCKALWSVCKLQADSILFSG